METKTDMDAELRERLDALLDSPVIRFDRNCRRSLPPKHGIYRIFEMANRTPTIRAGRTISAAEGLRQRVYQNHLMGDQKGNLRAQLVASGECENLDEAKRFIRDRLAVQVLVVEGETERSRLEHYMLAVLSPKYSD